MYNIDCPQMAKMANISRYYIMIIIIINMLNEKEIHRKVFVLWLLSFDVTHT